MKKPNKTVNVEPKKEVEILFDKYAESHKNHTNEIIH